MTLLTAVVTVIVAAVGMPAAVAQSAPARDPAGAIAYVHPTGHVAVIDSPLAGEGSGLTVYGSGRQLAIFPAWSSDGNRIAAVTATERGGIVQIIDVANGGEPLVALEGQGRGPIYLNWSPDDRYLAVLSNTPAGILALDLVDMPAVMAGAPASRTLSFGQPFYWVWSATGRSILVHRDVLRRTAVVGLTSVAAFDVQRPLASPGAFQSPAISDSGRYIAYSSLDGSDGSVVVVGNPELGSSAEPVVRLPQRDLVAFGWRPGSEQLSVQGATSAGTFVGRLDLLDVASGVARTLSAKEVVASFWSPDGRWIAALSRRSGGVQQVSAIAADLHPVQALGPLLELDLIEADTRHVVEHGAVRLSAAFGSQYLPFFDQYSRSHSLWAPDSSAIVLPETGPTGTPQLVVHFVAGERIELVAGDMPAWNVR